MGWNWHNISSSRWGRGSPPLIYPDRNFFVKGKWTFQVNDRKEWRSGRGGVEKGVYIAATRPFSMASMIGFARNICTHESRLPRNGNNAHRGSGDAYYGGGARGRESGFINLDEMRARMCVCVYAFVRSSYVGGKKRRANSGVSSGVGIAHTHHGVRVISLYWRRHAMFQRWNTRRVELKKKKIFFFLFFFTRWNTSTGATERRVASNWRLSFDGGVGVQSGIVPLRFWNRNSVRTNHFRWQIFDRCFVKFSLGMIILYSFSLGSFASSLAYNITLKFSWSLSPEKFLLPVWTVVSLPRLFKKDSI